jgi:hypothetical protein
LTTSTCPSRLTIRSASSKQGKRAGGKGDIAGFSSSSNARLTCLRVVPWMRVSVTVDSHHGQLGQTCEGPPLERVGLRVGDLAFDLPLVPGRVRPGGQNDRSVVLRECLELGVQLAARSGSHRLCRPGKPAIEIVAFASGGLAPVFRTGFGLGGCLHVPRDGLPIDSKPCGDPAIRPVQPHESENCLMLCHLEPIRHL